MVEILELCTAYGTRLNELTGAKLKEIAARQGYEMGRVQASLERPSFREIFRHQQHDSHVPKSGKPEAVQFGGEASLTREIRLVVAGSAGERVQSAASLFCRAALAAGLYSTQKNDNPVTQGSGFSLAEVCASPEPIEYTGMESPDVVIVASREGLKELQANGTLARSRPETLVLLDDELEISSLQGRILRLPLRRTASPPPGRPRSPPHPPTAAPNSAMRCVSDVAWPIARRQGGSENSWGASLLLGRAWSR